MGWRKPPLEQGLGRAVLGRYPPSKRGLSAAPGLGAHSQAVCSHLIKCLLTCGRHFDILGLTLLDKEHKKNALLL